jgi:hypothetical protein
VVKWLRLWEEVRRVLRNIDATLGDAKRKLGRLGHALEEEGSGRVRERRLEEISKEKARV